MDLRVENYGKGIIVRGKDTQKYKDLIKGIIPGLAKFSHGNMDHGEPGWIFPGIKREIVKKAIDTNFEGINPVVYNPSTSSSSPQQPKFNETKDISYYVKSPEKKVIEKSIEESIEERIANIEKLLLLIVSNTDLESVKEISDLVSTVKNINKKKQENNIQSNQVISDLVFEDEDNIESIRRLKL